MESVATISALPKPAPTSLKEILEKEDISFYVDQSSNKLPEWVDSLATCVSLLNTQQHGHVVVRMLQKIDWSTSNENVIRSFNNFMLNLLSAQSQFLEIILFGLIKKFFVTSKGNLNFLLHRLGDLSPPEVYTANIRCFERIHSSLRNILNLVPSSTGSVVLILFQSIPHHARHEVDTLFIFMKNMLYIVEYCPVLKEKLIDKYFDVMIQLDVSINLDDIPDDDDIFFGANVDDQKLKENPKRARMLDYLMELIFQYLQQKTQPSSDQTTKDDTFNLTLRLFDLKILHTHKSKYTQYVMFFLCKQHPEFAEKFLAYLLNRVVSHKDHILTRTTCVLYVASFLSRAKYVASSMARDCVSLLVQWAHEYDNNSRASKPFPDAGVHALFYTVVQAVLYIICFHHEALFDGEKGKAYCQRLELDVLMQSPLNPLKFCLNSVVQEFVNISDDLGLPVAASVVAKNQTVFLPTKSVNGTPNRLECFFPFEPYLLKVSSPFVVEDYREWSKSQADEEEKVSDQDQVSNSSNQFQKKEEEEEETEMTGSLGDFTKMSLTPGDINPLNPLHQYHQDFDDNTPQNSGTPVSCSQ
jgi:RNA polymerase I-specific transcription initiation factor RRN3